MTDFKFDVPSHHKSIIKVIGVGGGGSNAVSYMYSQGIKDVEFVICNTDHQALESSPVKEKLQIGTQMTEGLGAGARPEVGASAASESKEEIRKLLSKDTKMLFITAGMGGGTGTGAAPVIAEIARELDILTVGIVTMPFAFEGKRKKKYAEEGISKLKQHCDTVLVILNERLKEVYGGLVINEAFSRADDVLTDAARSIAQIITHKAQMNVDFQDVRTIMKSSGHTVMGSAIAKGENRAAEAVEKALSSPLLNNRDLNGAQRVLLSITYAQDAAITIDELTSITDYVDDCIGEESDEVIWGHGVDEKLETGEVRVTVIATGFVEDKAPDERQVVNLESIKKVEITNRAVETPPAPQQEPAPRPEPRSIPQERVVVNLDEEGEEKTLSTNSNEIMRKREIRLKEVQDRLKRMEEVRRLRGDVTSDEGYQAYFDKPAFARKNRDLDHAPKSDESNASRYNLNEDDDIVGNNRFFDDNVD